MSVTTLSRTDHARARRFMMETARPLERALYLHAYEGGPLDDALAELARFQNEDGGYGHGLEPDSTTPASSVLNTSEALQRLRRLGVPREHPLVADALRYLLAQYDLAHGVWPFMCPAADQHPRAPWLTYDPDWTHSTINPTAEVVGHLLTYGALDICRCVDVLGRALIHIEAVEGPLIMHDLLCVLRLAATPDLPAVPARTLAERLTRDIPQVVESDPAAWGGYSLEPLWVAPAPDAPYYALVAEHIPANLDDRIARQGEDGAWWPNWSWDGTYPAEWQVAREAWKGILTLDTLRVLRAYGRLA